MGRVADRRQFFILIAAIGALAIFSSTLSKTPVLSLFAADLGATPAEIGWIVIASRSREYSSRRASRSPHQRDRGHASRRHLSLYRM